MEDAQSYRGYCFVPSVFNANDYLDSIDRLRGHKETIDTTGPSGERLFCIKFTVAKIERDKYEFASHTYNSVEISVYEEGKDKQVEQIHAILNLQFPSEYKPWRANRGNMFSVIVPTITIIKQNCDDKKLEEILKNITPPNLQIAKGNITR